MGSIAETLNESCALRHSATVTHRQVLGWVTGILLGLLGAAVTAGSAQMRLSVVEARQEAITSQLREANDARNELAVELAVIKNDLVWTSDAVRRIALKLEVDVPQKLAKP